MASEGSRGVGLDLTAHKIHELRSQANTVHRENTWAYLIVIVLYKCGSSLHLRIHHPIWCN